MENLSFLDPTSVNKTFLFILSILFGSLIALICDPKKKRFWVKLGDKSALNAPSVFLSLTVSAYFIIAFASLNFLLLSFGWNILLSLLVGAIIGCFFIITAFISGLIIISLRQAFYFLAKPKKKNNSFRRRKFNKGLQFYFAIIAVLMMSVWLFDAADNDWLLAAVPPLAFLIVLKVSRRLKKISREVISVCYFFRVNDSFRVGHYD